MHIAVLGAGLQAEGAGFYLANDRRVKEITFYDISTQRLVRCARRTGQKKTNLYVFDANDLRGFQKRLARYDGVINTLPYALLINTTKACILAGKPMVDLGGNDKVADEQSKMHQKALDNGAIIVPGCGLARGIISDLAFYAKGKLASCHSIKMFCGGLPQKPEGILNHALFLNEQGLYNEYAEYPIIKDCGQIRQMPPLTRDEDVDFNGWHFESALTHGAFCPSDSLWQDVHNISYATLRWPGHFKELRRKIFSLSRDECVLWLKQNLPPAGKDMVIATVSVRGRQWRWKEKPLIYNVSLYDRFDQENGLSAMQRCTAFPAAETLLQIIESKSWPCGVLHHEPFVDMDKMIENAIKKYGMDFQEKLIGPKIK